MKTKTTLRAIVWAACIVSCVNIAGAAPAPTYLKLPTPQRIDWPDQSWEGDQQGHTLSVLELNRDGFKYWGWYGLNNGRGVGLARSNDLVHWTKYEKNPLWLNARWPSALLGVDKQHPTDVYLAITRDYDTPSSRIVLAKTEDGVHLTEIKTLVQRVPDERNQNPDFFRDPTSGKYFLYFYRGNDTNYFDIVARSAANPMDLDTAADKLLLHTTETVAAPNMLYVPKGPGSKGIYYLATEIYPGRYDDKNKGEWQVKVFYSDAADGKFEPVAKNPVQAGERACLFQHTFNGKYYGYQSILDTKTQKWGMEVLVTDLTTAP